MHFRGFTLLSVFTIFLVTLFSSLPQAYGAGNSVDRSFKPSSPFSQALETLQKQIGFTFKSIGLLRRAMTHASFSEENNKALSILGSHVIETSVSLRSLEKDIDLSSKELNKLILEISNVESSCAVDGARLGLHKVIRVSPKTDPSSPTIVCLAFRAVLGAIAVDSGNTDEAVKIFWSIHNDKVGRAVSV
ncbi:protein NUCLEAR FUSION DEFECTIVE 2-like [Durio zibethinus]|uniref:Protein NUCLEAR FUSION DEFECTIVE 2-like n=1 Tax=Durio zibethinus TaxID=66656 RepID=A0A6P5YE60_DURZI|nr:protein NUCLEAR FUSION DEFECTIVE 2-like [Durio zibethinus]